MEDKQIEPQEESKHASNKRPIGVWIICIWLGLGAIFTLIGFAYAPAELFAKFTQLELIFSVLIVILNLIASFFLFCLKKRSFWIFIFSLLMSFIPILLRLYNGHMDEYLDRAENSTLIQSVIWAWILIYIWTLKKKNILT